MCTLEFKLDKLFGFGAVVFSIILLSKSYFQQLSPEVRHSLPIQPFAVQFFMSQMINA